ncbi:MAG: Acyl-CoA thioesterase-2 [Pseudomonas sp.]|jgi:acyl-CoA thioesterase-2|uniref:acyl-CoA thioesterase n=1 Tax=Pseudomonas sp. TaxID=306 RepID=UPI002604D300|nr:acyl-CoA thioesterase domain-containing protein [Pseudomonas sp.]MDB6052131.1 Acyl-CoA thioesterase-2 [Pseudomonas sp.]
MTADHPPQARLWNQRALIDLLPFAHGDSQVFTALQHDANLNGRVFGGQLVAQALLAAQRCCSNKHAATLQCLFLQGALPDSPVSYAVTTLQEGKRFASFHVSGRQQERRVLDAQVTFHTPMEGFVHVEAAPVVPDPGELLSMTQMRDGDNADWGRFEKSCLQLRIVEPQRYLRQTSAEPKLVFWLKLHERLPDEPSLHAAALAYLSDFWVNSAAIFRHVPLMEARERLFIASLNHSVWFHRPCRADQWLLFVCESPSLQASRALSHVRIFDESRQLVASAAQDGLISPRH